MKYQIPKTTFTGKPVEGAMKRVLEKNPTPVVNPLPNTNAPLITNLRSPEDYILLPGRTYGNFAYANSLVSMYKLGMSPEVEQANQQLGYQLRNTEKESNGRDYIGNINWKQALTLNLALGGFTLNPRRFADFLLLLKSGNAVDGTGNNIQKSKLEEVLDEIVTVRSPYRAEWLDADFKYLNGKLWIYSNHKLDISGKNIDANDLKELESCLMTKGSKINLGTINFQGMPTEEGNDFQYWCPDNDNNSVARFDAYSGGADLSCNGIPTGVSSSLGVRHVREARTQKN